VVNRASRGSEKDKGDGGLCIAVCSLLAAIPALIGS